MSDPVTVTISDGEEEETLSLAPYRSIMGGQHYVNVSSTRWSVSDTYMSAAEARAYAAALVQVAEQVEAAVAAEAALQAEYERQGL